MLQGTLILPERLESRILPSCLCVPILGGISTDQERQHFLASAEKRTCSRVFNTCSSNEKLLVAKGDMISTQTWKLSAFPTGAISMREFSIAMPTASTPTPLGVMPTS